MSARTERGAYVFDTGPLLHLFEHYDPAVFPDIWTEFNRMLARGRILSVREVLREIEYGPKSLLDWVEVNAVVFAPPNAEQTEFLREMLGNRHFQGMIDRKKFLKGGGAADPFVVALARVRGGCVVTTEKHRENAPKIPTVCEEFDIPCVNLSGFMKREGWKFVRDKNE